MQDQDPLSVHLRLIYIARDSYSFSCAKLHVCLTKTFFCFFPSVSSWFLSFQFVLSNNANLNIHAQAFCELFMILSGLVH